MESDFFDKLSADYMAAVIDHMIELRQLDSRSALGDARLDYGEPFDIVERSRILCRGRKAHRKEVREKGSRYDG